MAIYIYIGCILSLLQIMVTEKLDNLEEVIDKGNNQY